MFENTKRNMTLVSAGAALTFCLAGAAAVGALPRPGASPDAGSTDIAASATAPVPAEEVTTTTAPPPPPPTSPPPTAPRATTPRVTAPRSTAHAARPAEAAPAAAETAPAKPPRVNPSSAQVQAALATMPQSLLFRPTEAQARQFGDQVCTAFDQGQSFAQIKAAALQAASRIPLVSVSAADADRAVRTAVNLFCPGYQSQLG